MLFIASLRSMCLQFNHQSMNQSLHQELSLCRVRAMTSSWPAYLWMRCCANVSASGVASTRRDWPSANLSWASLSWFASDSLVDAIFSVEKSCDCFWRSCFQASISPVTWKTQSWSSPFQPHARRENLYGKVECKWTSSVHCCNMRSCK